MQVLFWADVNTMKTKAILFRGFLAAVLIGLVYGLFLLHTLEVHREVDNHIVAAIEEVNARIPSEYFDRAISSEVLTPQEYHHFRDVIREIAEEHTIANLYSMVEIEGKYYLTLFNHLTPYFLEYDPVQEGWLNLIKTSQDGQERWDTGEDSYGLTRTCVRRCCTPGGQKYLVGADVLVSEITGKRWSFLLRFLPTTRPLIVMSLVFGGLLLVLSVWMLRKRQLVLCLCTWLILLIVLGVGSSQIAAEDRIQTKTWRKALVDMTKVFAEQTMKMGHSKIVRPLCDSPEGEKAYKNILESHTRWCRDVDLIIYVTTYRLIGTLSEKKMEFIMSCPSDVDGDGQYSTKVEKGDPPFTPFYDDEAGTVYTWGKAFEDGFGGMTSFDSQVYSPLYGASLACVTPLYDEQGQVDGVLAVDFDIVKWEQITYVLLRRSLVLLGCVCTSILVISIFISHLLDFLVRTRRINRELADRTNWLIWSESKMEAVLAGNTAMVFYGPDGTIESVNSAMERMLGYTEEETVGRKLPEFYREMMHKRGLEIREGMIQGNYDDFRTDVPLIHKDGHTVWADVSVTAVRDASESIVQIVAICVDVTEERMLLENLQAAKNEAESASRTKSEFLATMSHEIRTPLNGVIGLSDLLLGTELNVKQLEYAEMIKVSGELLLYLINDILDFSKIEAGKLEIASEDFDILETVESSAAILASRARDRDIALCVSFSGTLPRRLRGDAGRIRQVLLNLIGNAIKFTDQGGVRVVVTPETWEEERVVLLFSITDTGIGIAEEGMNRLFKTFSQADASSARAYGGTGLGLAISRRLVELMGGEISVDSVVGKGSTFWFRVPFGCNKEISDCISNELFLCRQQETLHCVHSGGSFCVGASHFGQCSGLTLAGKRVLIVSSNDIVRISLSEQLATWKMRVSEARTGEEAMDILRHAIEKQQPFSLIFIDEPLEDELGKELAKMICGEPTFEEVGITWLRSFAVDVDKEPNPCECLRYLTKPIYYSALFDMVMTQLYEHQWSRFLEENKTRMPLMSSLLKRHFPDSEEELARESEEAVGLKVRAGRVLVAEDNRVNQIVIRNILEVSGYECLLAINGREAADLAKTERLDLILMDCQMPETDGYEATLLIRNWEREQGQLRTPIIALTANATQEDAEKCFAVGMDAFCSKPVDAKKLLKEMRKWIQ
ncbi:MAG: response regulator [Thermoguttaceae bacterium]